MVSAVLGLRAAHLFDGRSGDLVERPVLLVDGGRIAGVAQGDPELPEGTEVVDLGPGVTLLPGLVDTHVHLGLDSSRDPVGQMIADDDGTLLLRMRRAAEASLRAGVTTVRDLGDRGYLGVTLRDWYRRGPELGPEVLAAGPPVTITGGHCHFMGGEADGEDGVRQAVRERAARGVNVIKVMGTGGVLTLDTGPTTAQYTVAEMRALVDEAHAAGLPVTVHAHGVPGIEVAVAAGVDGIEHCGFWVDEGVRAEQALVDRIAEAGIVVCPTAGVAPGSPPPPPVASRIDAMVEAFGRLHRAGVPLTAGTDAGIAPSKPHGMVAFAAGHLGEVPLSPVDCVRAATSVGAEACGLAGRKGVLAPGADADVLAVGGNPLTDLAVLHDVRAVFRAGVRVPEVHAPGRALLSAGRPEGLRQPLY